MDFTELNPNQNKEETKSSLRMDFFEQPKQSKKPTKGKKIKVATLELDEEEEVEDCNKDFEEPLDLTATEIPRNI